MAAAELIPVPDPSRQDIEDVQCALAVAAARWEHGDYEDSLRWLRRAARAAADHQHLERALELSKAAARMSKRLSQPPPPPRRSQPAPRSNGATPPGLSPVLPLRRTPLPTRQEGTTPRIPPRRPPAPRPIARTPRAMMRPPAKGRRSPTAWELPSIVGADDEDDPTIIRFVPSQRDTRPDTRPHTPKTPAPLSAARVAVMRDPDTGRPTLMVLAPDVPAPRGAAVAMLVASSSDDTTLLGEILEDFVLETS